MSPFPRAGAAAAPDPQSEGGLGEGERRVQASAMGGGGGASNTSTLILRSVAAAVDRWRPESDSRTLTPQPCSHTSGARVPPARQTSPPEPV